MCSWALHHQLTARKRCANYINCRHAICFHSKGLLAFEPSPTSLDKASKVMLQGNALQSGSKISLLLYGLVHTGLQNTAQAKLALPWPGSHTLYLIVLMPRRQKGQFSQILIHLSRYCVTPPTESPSFIAGEREPLLGQEVVFEPVCRVCAPPSWKSAMYHSQRKAEAVSLHRIPAAAVH